MSCWADSAPLRMVKCNVSKFHEVRTVLMDIRGTKLLIHRDDARKAGDRSMLPRAHTDDAAVAHIHSPL
jgi:hypothetical protein